MKAFFADLDEPGLARDGGGRNGPEAWGVKLQLPTASETQQLEKLDAAIATARQKLAAAAKQRASDRAAWASTAADRFNRGELRWQFVRPQSATAREATLSIHDDLGVRIGSLLRFHQKSVKGLIVASGKNPDTESYTVTLKPGKGVWRSLGSRDRARRHPAGWVCGARRSRCRAERGRGVGGARCGRAAQGELLDRYRQRNPQRPGRIGGRDGDRRDRRRREDIMARWRLRDVGVESLRRAPVRRAGDDQRGQRARRRVPPGVQHAPRHARPVPSRALGRTSVAG